MQFSYCSGAQVALLCSAAPFQSNIARQHHGQWCGWRLPEQGLTLARARFFSDKLSGSVTVCGTAVSFLCHLPECAKER